jgi:hypothetical protein
VYILDFDNDSEELMHWNRDHWGSLNWVFSAEMLALVVIKHIPKSIGMGNTGILVCESIFENPVLIDIVLACRNKSTVGAFGIFWAGFAIGLGFWVARGIARLRSCSAFVII